MKKSGILGAASSGAVLAAAFLSAAVLLSSCQKATCSNCNFSQMTNSASTAPVGTFSLSQPSPVNSNLGIQNTFPVTVTADSIFSGNVSFAVMEPELKILDPGQGITFSFSPSSIILTPNSSATVMVTVNVTTMAPSFASSVFHIQATDVSHPAGQAFISSVQVPIQVNAVFNMNLYGPLTAGQQSPEKWTVAPGAIVGFITHTEGLKVNFNNYDSAVHLIHSGGGPIPHESTTVPFPGTNIIGIPPSPDGGKTPGGPYSVTVTPSMTGASPVYCHFHESGTQARTLQFNLPVPMPTPTPTPTPNPNATFTNINATILQPKCVTCHSGAAPSGGVDLTTYTNVLNVVVPGDAAASTLYIVVAPPNPTMPKDGTPLSSSDVQNISDWINAGAKNN